MCTTSSRRPKKISRRLVSNKRGFSSIVGAIFAALVIISLASTVLIWTLRLNTNYYNTITQIRQTDSDRSNEKVVGNLTGLDVSNNIVSVNATFENPGPLSTQMSTLWIADSTRKTYGFNNSISVNLASGDKKIVSNIKVNVTVSSSSDSFSCWAITSRGNNVPLTNGTTNTGTTTIYSAVSGGIGSIAVDFPSFRHNHPANANNGTSVGLSWNNLTIPDSLSIFNLTLINYDPSHQTIYLSADSYAWVPTLRDSGVQSVSWKIMNVTNGKIITTPAFSNVSLVYGVPTLVYFGVADFWTTRSQTVNGGLTLGLNMVLFGKIAVQGGPQTDFGQILPFKALKFPYP